MSTNSDFNWIAYICMPYMIFKQMRKGFIEKLAPGSIVSFQMLMFMLI